jgi:hypothetical protein
MVLVTGLLSSCGSSARPAAVSAARVQSGTCQGTHGATRVVVDSCLFLLSDGQQFSCSLTHAGNALNGRMPTEAVLEHTTGCKRLAALRLSPALRGVLASVNRARGCLKGKGLSALGGLPPKPPESSTPDGELVLSKSSAFVAYYTDAATATAAAPEINRNAPRGSRVERRGAVTILWTRPPSQSVRSALERCVFG